MKKEIDAWIYDPKRSLFKKKKTEKAVGYIIYCECHEKCELYAKINSTDPMIHKNDIELIEPNADIDWEQRRYELVKEFSKEHIRLQPYKGRSETGYIIPYVVEWSVELADALINELKKRK